MTDQKKTAKTKTVPDMIAKPAPAPASETAPETPQAAAPETGGTSEPEIRRGRGRPPKDSAAPVSPGSDTPQPKRGRPKSGKKEAVDIGALAKQLQGLHAIAAMVTGLPQLQIAPQEAEMLSSAIVNVCEEYDLSVSGKTGAALQLFAAAGMIYIPRIPQIQQQIMVNKHNAAMQRAHDRAGASDAPETPIG